MLGNMVLRRHFDGIDNLLVTYYHDGDALTSAKYTPSAGDADYSATYAYDRNSNITALTRKGLTGRLGTFGTVDDLVMTYDGNRLSKVTETADEVLLETSHDMQPMAITRPTVSQFRYDANGNTIMDRPRSISSITYNHLNLPQSVSIENSPNNLISNPANRKYISYTYDASGVKHRVIHSSTRLNVSPTGRLTTADTTLYVGSRIYLNGKLDKVLTPYGYLQGGKFHTWLHDYQGNVAVVVVGDSVAQCNSYYPYGLPHATLSIRTNVTTNTPNTYKYSGKEFDTFGGTDLYDFHARYHAPSTGRFMTPDPMAEKYPGISPYMYCAGNPIIFIDTDGRELKLVGTQEDINRTLFHYQTGLGSAYNIQISNNGIILINANSAVSSGAIPQTNREYYNILNRVISDKQTTTLNVQKNVPEIIGDIKTGSVDVNDLDKLGDGEFINASSALLHETYEQYQIQTKNTHPTKAHLNAAGAEERVTGTFPSPLQREANIENRQMVIPILNGIKHDTQVGTVTILFDENNNITNVKRTKITYQNNDE